MSNTKTNIMTDTDINLKTPLKRGYARLYFPDFPDHPYNGAAMDMLGSFVGQKGELMIRAFC